MAVVENNTSVTFSFVAAVLFFSIILVIIEHNTIQDIIPGFLEFLAWIVIIFSVAYFIVKLFF